MSRQNHLIVKRQRRAERSTRKTRAVPFHGVGVSKKDVLGHRYLYWHHLPYSESVAAVRLEGDAA